MDRSVCIEEVDSRRARRDFIELPRALYRGDPYWVPPLWAEERKAWSPRHNPVLAHSDCTLLLARRGGVPVGRILAYVDHNFNSFYSSRIGFFGGFECRDDPEAAAALLARAEGWLAARGMGVVRGPVNAVSESLGFLVEGFGRSPAFLSPYNPPYYNRFVLEAGYAKVKDLLVYEGDAQNSYRIPERFLRFAEKLPARRPTLSVRRFDPRRLREEAQAIWRLSNLALRHNWGYVPLDRRELEDMVRRLKPVADPDAIWFVEDRGLPVAFALGFPDLNVIIKRIGGRLFPFGLFRLLLGARRLRDYRLFGLAVDPRYHGLGLDVFLYVQLYRALAPRGVRLEANWVLEDNLRIRNALEKLKLRRIRTYRIYEKRPG